MKRMYGLDALRGVAAIYVMFYHTTLLDEYITDGVLAVDLFMMLSGYVLTQIYDEKLRNGLEIRTFLNIRIRRLWPIMAIGSAIGFFAALMTGVPLYYAIGSLILIMAFLPSPPIGDRIFVINTPVWSLHYELLANLFHALLFAQLTTKHLAIICTAMTIVFSIMAIQTGHIVTGYSASGYLPAFPHLITAYIIGILLRRTEWNPGLPAWLCIVALPVSIVICGAIDNGFSRIVFIVIVAPVLVASCANAKFPSWALWLGAISYPLYCLHIPVFKLLAPFGYIVSIPIAIGLSIIVTLLWEPSLKKRKQVDKVNNN